MSSQQISNKYIFYDQNLQNEYMFMKDLYFACNKHFLYKNIFFK